ncbi:hypothetical protein [Streptomyces fulvoviolaceus]|nr:hypothetical protein [Streptomyces fulvoviolaceus]MCT9077886.1 hypothetical protein [Streptomyces fulvoviolaceus]
MVLLSGECEVTASGETVIARPGDLLLVEDTTGTGHRAPAARGR